MKPPTGYLRQGTKVEALWNDGKVYGVVFGWRGDLREYEIKVGDHLYNVLPGRVRAINMADPADLGLWLGS